MLRLGTLLFGLAILIAASGDSRAQSQPPTPSPPESQSHTQPEPQGNQQRPANNQQGTEQSPFVVKILRPEPKATNRTDQNAKGSDHDSADWWMVRATIGIGLIGFLQLVAFIVQAVYLAKSANEMHKTTEATQNVSLDQIAHAHKVERAYISGGGDRNKVFIRHGATNQEAVYAPGDEFVFMVNNYGKTAGRLVEVGYGFCDAEKVPPDPVYVPQYFLDWIQPGDRGRAIFKKPIPPSATAVYGRFYYWDIFGEKKHSCGFINRIVPKDESVPILAAAAYTEERDEG